MRKAQTKRWCEPRMRPALTDDSKKRSSSVSHIAYLMILQKCIPVLSPVKSVRVAMLLPLADPCMDIRRQSCTNCCHPANGHHNSKFDYKTLAGDKRK